MITTRKVTFHLRTSSSSTWEAAVRTIQSQSLPVPPATHTLASASPTSGVATENHLEKTARVTTGTATQSLVGRAASSAKVSSVEVPEGSGSRLKIRMPATQCYRTKSIWTSPRNSTAGTTAWTATRIKAQGFQSVATRKSKRHPNDSHKWTTTKTSKALRTSLAMMTRGRA